MTWVWRALGVAGFVWLANQAACSASADDAEASGTGGFGGVAAGGAGNAAGVGSGAGGASDGSLIDVDQPDARPDGGGLHPLCALGCRLDDARACPAAGSTPEGGAPASDASDGAADAPPDESPLGCVVNDARSASCGAVGAGESGAPCLSQQDCAPGHGCVGDDTAATCRPFCCEGNPSCGDPSTVCVEKPLRDALSTTAGLPRAPVSVPADNCSLSEPYPCPTGEKCACPSGTACLVVRPEGTTSCVEPGKGTVDEPCPCAWGYVCSKATDRCLALCALEATDAPCGNGRCQATGQLPDGWGVCIGDRDGG